jgi:carboxylesterase
MEIKSKLTDINMSYVKGSEPYSNVTNSDVGVLVIHGFTGTTSSLSPLNEAFTKSGYNVECPRLTGHGSNWQELEKATFQNWIYDVEKALDTLKKRSQKIFVASLSMGGALTLHLAAKHPEIKGLILVNNALIMRNIRILLIPLVKHFLRCAPGIGSDIKDGSKKEICNETVPTKAVHELLKLLSFVRKHLPEVNQPVLIFKSKKDHVVPVVSATYTLKKISSTRKELVWLENSYHVATLDYDKDLICEKALEFVKSLI